MVPPASTLPLLVSYYGYSKRPQVRYLGGVLNDCLGVLEGRSSRWVPLGENQIVSRAAVLLCVGALGENPFPCLFWAREGTQIPLLKAPGLHLQSQKKIKIRESSSQQIALTLSLCLPRPHSRALVVMLDPPVCSGVIFVCSGQQVGHFNSICDFTSPVMQPHILTGPGLCMWASLGDHDSGCWLC